ncbi:MAG: gluconokinase [Chloroflexota bacterium]|nr:gluconokinase [Chloroflexota bacterium]
MRSIGISEAQEPLVLAIDVGSSSVRALLYDRAGDQVDGSERQLAYTQRMTPDGGSESDPIELLDLVTLCVDGVVNNPALNAPPIAAVGMTSFWHGLMGIDQSGGACTPIYMWSDKRSGDDATRLATELDVREVHQRTGCRIHSSYWPAKLRWLHRTQPENHGRVRQWLSVTDYLHREFFGLLETSISMASGTGLLNGTTLDWDEGMLEILDLEDDDLPPIRDRSLPHNGLRSDLATRWPTLANVPWYPAIGDGAAANVGAGCVGADRIAMTIGTSAAMRLIVTGGSGNEPLPALPHRIWRYQLDREHQVLGGALSNGGNVTGWFANHLALGDFEALTDAAKLIEPDGHGLTILPFLAGERSPSWHENATGTISGLRLSTTAGDLFRATLEATAYRMAAIYDDIKLLAAPEHEIHANGAAVLSSPLWLQIIADTLNHRLDAVDAEAEASARGAAICALESLGALSSLCDPGNSVSETYVPDASAHARYRTACDRQSNLEAAITGLSQSP